MNYLEMNLALIAVHVALQLADVFVTEKGLKLGIREANPLARWLIDHVGFDASYAIKIVIPAAALWYANIVPLTIALNVFMLFIVVRNIKILNKYD